MITYEQHLTMSDTAIPQQLEQIDSLLEAISGDAFGEWYREWQIRQAFREGDSWKQTPASIKPPTQHAPSQLLQCQRKTFYSAQNAPQEESPPLGIFWAGTRIEEDLVQPFLEDVADEIPEAPTFVRNSIWVDYQVKTDAGEVHIRGATDPVLCTSMGEPLLPTEVKAKQSLDAVDETDPEPAAHHRAQLHAYMHGLNQQVEHSIQRGLVIYVDREQHELVAINVPFDAEFWESRVLDWAATQSEYRLEDELPPAAPSFGWECSYCSFEKRCGEADGPYTDMPAAGFLPLTTYPREQVTTALEAEGGAHALTPTLAHQYPEIAEDHEVKDWQCPVCGETTEWVDVDWDGPVTAPPNCPACTAAGRPVELRGPTPQQKDDD
jgi:CRISPR/Cas system-associated exonuclease Cas4 (RecB family)